MFQPQGKSYNNVRNLVHPREQLQQWVWWVFRDLPLTYLARIMDCYLVEGLKVFYRVALTVLQMHKKQSSQYTYSTALTNRSSLEDVAIVETCAKMLTLPMSTNIRENQDVKLNQ